MIDGVPVGREIPMAEIPGPDPVAEGGSVIVVLATDAPLCAHQCRRLAQRAALGIARMGGGGENDSGDFFLAFATGNRGLTAEDEGQSVTEAQSACSTTTTSTPLLGGHRVHRGGGAELAGGGRDHDRQRRHLPRAAG